MVRRKHPPPKLPGLMHRAPWEWRRGRTAFFPDVLDRLETALGAVMDERDEELRRQLLQAITHDYIVLLHNFEVPHKPLRLMNDALRLRPPRPFFVTESDGQLQLEWRDPVLFYSPSRQVSRLDRGSCQLFSDDIPVWLISHTLSQLGIGAVWSGKRVWVFLRPAVFGPRALPWRSEQPATASLTRSQVVTRRGKAKPRPTPKPSTKP